MSGGIEPMSVNERLSSTARCPVNTYSRCTSCPGRIRPDKQVLEGHLAVLHARREDRRPGPQRLRQVDAAADHGRARHRVPRRGAARSRRLRRAARAGAPARREQGRARQRRGRRGGDPCAARPLQRARRQLLRRHRGRVRAHPGAHRRGRRLEPGHAARHRHGCAAFAPFRRRRNQVVGRRAPPRGAVPAAAERAGPAAARRADQPPRRRVGRAGWSGTSRTTRAPSSP